MEKKHYKIGYTSGVYDMFHVGHLNMIQTAKEYSEFLIVGVHGDDVVAEYKHSNPIINENDRKRLMGHSFGKDITNSVYGHRELDDLRKEIEKIIVKS